jgi:predicted small metal-binding protein
MSMSAPKEQERALIAAIKFHVKTEHKMDAMDDDVRRRLSPMKDEQTRGAMSDIM